MIDQLKAFLIGMQEFRSSVTTSYGALELRDAYDYGRELAHRITLRHWDY